LKITYETIGGIVVFDLETWIKLKDWLIAHGVEVTEKREDKESGKL